MKHLQAYYLEFLAESQISRSQNERLSHLNEKLRAKLKDNNWKKERGYYYSNPCMKFNDLDLKLSFFQYGYKTKLEKKIEKYFDSFNKKNGINFNQLFVF
jgi:hypothetical protein